MTPYTLRNILTRHAPERISQLEKKHILNVHCYISDTEIDDDGNGVELETGGIVTPSDLIGDTM